jgi:hypothetical protein
VIVLHPSSDPSRLLDVIVDHLDIPPSYYEKAAARHRSLGEWLQRDGSTLARFAPDVRPQGSFRFGTVIRPVRVGEEYDLDNVCVLTALGKTELTQQQLKELYGGEVAAYAKANNMLHPATEHNRCWRLHYADEVAFHLDTLPCVPEDDEVRRAIATDGVPWELARRTVAITDRRHPNYRRVAPDWLTSNPRGFAAWFERQAALGRDRAIAEGKARATIEDVPPYAWKTTLQRSIQILKRHRDVMFLNAPKLAPISMIITNLAAQAYIGEPDLTTALCNIVERMPEFVRDRAPRVPNPANIAEDYADRWASNPQLEKSFWAWHKQVKADVDKLPTLLQGTGLQEELRHRLRVELTEAELRRFEPRRAAPPSITTPAVVPSKPWGGSA